MLLALAGMGGSYVWATFQPPAVPPETLPGSPDPTNPAASPAPDAPSFDIVRVGPDGGAVMAGRAAPDSVVTVHEGSRLVATATADARGNWVMVPGEKLAPGPGELTLSSRTPDGQAASAEAPVLVVVPPRPGAGKPAGLPALAVLAPPAGPARLLQGPQPRNAGHGLALDTVDYDERGAIHFSGVAPPGAPVRVYVDNAPMGDSAAGADGRWSLAPAAAVSPGVHHLRVDQLTAAGKVASRREIPFQRETLALSEVAAGQVVVQPGQTLWRLARRVYGSGVRYTVIVLANPDQIRDANHIYPGQVLNTPSAAGSSR